MKLTFSQKLFAIGPESYHSSSVMSHGIKARSFDRIRATEKKRAG
jgi:hypothetical protein